MNSRLTAMARTLAEVVVTQRQELSGRCLWTGSSSNGGQLQEAAALTTGLAATGDDLLELWLQAILCGAVACRQTRLSAAARRGMLQMSNAICRPLLREAVARATSKSDSVSDSVSDSAAGTLTWDNPRGLERTLSQVAALTDDPDAGLQFFEIFLAESDSSHRRRRGVYYTPRELARFIVRRVDQSLREQFGLVAGLADTSTWRQVHERIGQPIPAGVDEGEPFVTVLDPAAGTGVFLVELIDCIHDTLMTAWRDEGADPPEIRRRWNEYVPRHLLPRIVGLELMLPSLVVAHFQVAGKLDATGYDFGRPATLQLLPADTLGGPPPRDNDLGELAETLRRTVEQSWHLRYGQRFRVVLGNPPYSGISTNSGAWIGRLLRGWDGQARRANYYQAGGLPLGERKNWLQDDYVKFLRHAHWQIERSGCGVLGLVSNHGYLDNTTFRGLREQLLASFPWIEILDLHGNNKSKQQAPDAGVDENVFSIEQGVAVGFLVRPAAETAPSRRYGELWGTRHDKLRLLGGPTGELAEPRAIEPEAPHFFLVPRQVRDDRQYALAVPLPEAMPLNTTAPVTARDGLVVAFERHELRDRLARFRDLSIPDDQIRQECFQRRRSGRYPVGDTRGWKLDVARRQLAAMPDWSSAIRDCLYRPFDFRAVYWDDSMIDWPRGPVMRHLRDGDNLALIARRQMLPDQPCTFFWICDRIALDGVIRSDNRGSESLFPLYLNADRSGQLDLFGERNVNFSADFPTRLLERTGLRWHWQDRSPDDDLVCGPEDVLYYIYGVFHSPTYRQRYAEQLRTEFPRVLLPASAAVFRGLAQRGKQIAAHHLMRAPDPDRFREKGSDPFSGEKVVRRRKLRHVGGAVWLNDHQSVPGVTAEAWQFQAGGHQVCRKWLADRDGRTLSDDDLRHYGRLLAAVTATQRGMLEIDQFLESQGGWEVAFAGAPAKDAVVAMD